MAFHYPKIICLSFSIFLFVITGCNSATFEYCETNECEPILFALSKILNSFESLNNLKYGMSGIDYCKDWVFIRCDINGYIDVFNINTMEIKGVISPFFSNLSYLEHLDLADNLLTGEVPESLLYLHKLVELDIADNNLTGRLPNFNKRVEVKTSGNPFLEIINPTDDKGGRENGNNKTRQPISIKVIVLIVVVIFVIGLVAGFFLFKYYVNKRSSEGTVIQREFELPTFRGGNSFSIEVLRATTNNFDEARIIGRGGSANVYKGILPDGTEIAIKKMDSLAIDSRGLNEFEVEVDVLTRVRHRNLVTLLGHGTDGDQRFIVYEYMPQGTLKDHLLEFDRHRYSPLTWKQRATIALDISRGLEYLHGLTQRSFIHRDLKPSNVLLDNDMRAKISDFGLVKDVPEGQFSMETSRVAGTHGYIAPDYAMSQSVTTKVDVYAFGVILMELITGRRSLDSSLGEERYDLVTWFRQVMQNKSNIHDEIDHHINLDDDTITVIDKVAELAVHCTTWERADRPNMNYVVSVLSPLVEQWRPVSPVEDAPEAEGVVYRGMSLPRILEQWQGEEAQTSNAETRTSTLYFDFDN